MKDSAPTKQDESTSPVARPAWRFSGRRGTPVHLREQAPQTLPPEIRNAVTQLARERAGESAPAADAKPVRATSELKLSRQDRQAPPVSGAPMPVERRNRSEAAPAVPTSHIPAATAPIAEPATAAPSLEPAAAPEAEPAVAEAVPQAVTEPASVVPDVTAPDVSAAQAASTEPASDDAPSSDAPATTTPAAAPPATRSKPSKLSTAERKKVAKAKAKARARAERSTKDTTGTAAAERARRLFARGRDVAPDAAAVVEPAISAPVETEPTAEAMLAEAPGAEAPVVETPTVVETPVVETSVVETPVVETPAADAVTVEPPVTEPGIAETPVADAPLPPDVGDLPDVVPSIDAIDETDVPSFPALEPAAAWETSTEPASEPAPELELAVPTSLADVDLGASTAAEPEPATAQASAAAEVDVPEPALGAESAAQAAWHLGRVPFLLQHATPEAPKPIDSMPAAFWEPAPLQRDVAPPAAANIELVQAVEPTPQRVTLQPIDWLPVGSRPAPAPIEPIDMPRRSAPEAIQRLGVPLELPRDERALVRAGAREGMTASARTAEARRRIARRRSELDDLVESLAGLGSGRRDA